MDIQAHKGDAPLDAVSSASHWSKVSKKTTKLRSHFYWLVGGAIAVIFVLAISSHHTAGDEKNKKSKTTTMDNTNYSASLNANLARLRALANQPSAPDVASDNVPLIAKPVSKEYLARQNAPTSMYSASITRTSQSQSDSSIQEATFAGQCDNTQFANANTTNSSVEAKTILHPGFTIASGEFLHAVLETAINSDLPGMVRAVVSKPVYSYSDERTIIPAGSRLMGQYSLGITQGQNRVMIVWNRVVLPNGITVQLNSPGTDSLGRSGQGAGSVNTHFFSRFGQASLLSLIGVGTATAGVNDTDQANSVSAYRMAIAESFQQSAQQSLQGALPMKPTIYIYQGASINVFVAHDLSFYHVLKGIPELPHVMPYFVK